MSATKPYKRPELVRTGASSGAESSVKLERSCGHSVEPGLWGQIL